LSGDASSPLRTFQEGRTPFSTPIQVFGTGALYLTIVLGGREVMQRFKVPPQQLKTLFLFHNIALSLSSGLLLALMLEEILPVWYHQGFHSAICAESSWTPRMEFFYIINYMFKVIFSPRK
jgi:fatty acid elongase 3